MRWRPVAIVILVCFGAAVAAWSLSDYDDHVPLAIPPELADQIEPESVRFTCAAPFDSPSVTPSDGAAARELPLERAPCEETRNQRRLLAGLDLLAVVAGLIGVAMFRDRSAGETVHDTPSGDPAEAGP